MVAETQTHDPYVGPRPFEQQDIGVFFGRDREISELLSLIIAHRVVLLYAQSGTGKTSLLNAGVIPLLKEEGFEVLPVTRVQGHIPDSFTIDEKTNPYILNTLISWLENVKSYERLGQVTIPEFMKKRPHPKDDEGNPLPHIAIFDQFEEVFTSYLEHWKSREDFFKQIGGALEQDPYFRAVFVMREDYIAQLDPFVGFLPDKLRTRYRLERMRKEAALLAIREPIKDTNRSFAEGVPEQLVSEMLKISVETPEQTMVVTGEYVEPVQLQVVCQSLWRGLPADVKVITQDHLKTFGDVNQALANFYEQCLKRTVKLNRVREGSLRAWFETALITPSGTRGTVYRGKENTGGIKNEAVDELEDLHLVRAEYRAGARWYELTHDRFVGPIQKSNLMWRRALRRRRLILVIGVSATLVFMSLVIAFVGPLSAQNALDNLSTQTAVAVNSTAAINQTKSAGDQTQAAAVAAVLATKAANDLIQATIAMNNTAAANATYAAEDAAILATKAANDDLTATQVVVALTNPVQIRPTIIVPSDTPQPTPSPTPTVVPIARNADWKPLEQVINGVQMVLVPAGCFMMGNDQGEANERPVNQQCFDAPFWIDTYEVTKKAYDSIDDYHPRDSVNWSAAWNFCDQRGARLPTEREWEYAARGPDGLMYPWGNTFMGNNVVYIRNASNQTSPVGSRPSGASWVGANDMSGNVFEWTNSSYQSYPYNPDDGRENFGGDALTNQRVLRGGSYANNVSILGMTYRLNDKPDDEFNLIGFRCARSFTSGDTIPRFSVCIGSPTTRLFGLAQGRVVTGLGGSHIRADINSDTVIDSLPEGEVFNILDGPRCGDPSLQESWYRVEHNGNVGWIAEGKVDVYWLEPTSALSSTALAPAIQFTRNLFLTSPRQTGDDVRAVQSRLGELGYNTGPLDGLYGPITEEAVRQYQSDNGLTVDGIVGPVTWGHLFP